MDDYLEPPYAPVPVDKIMLAFPASVRHLMPDPETIPEKFSKNEWNDLASSWFSSGISANAKFYYKDGIDPETAFDHLLCIIRSYEPKHEHKLAAAAFLMDQWFDEVDLDNKK